MSDKLWNEDWRAGFEAGYRQALADAIAGVDRERAYREFRSEQDGSAVAACREMISYIAALGRHPGKQGVSGPLEHG